MALKGEAKKQYQRDYMRKRRLNSRLLDPSVRPDSTIGIAPMPWDNSIDTSDYKKTQDKLTTTTYRVVELDADGNPIPWD